MSFNSDTPPFLKACISPASFWQSDHIPSESAWLEHAPFAFWLMDSLRPRTFVELGTQHGFSYFSFCQAVERLRLETSCYAVDTWKGDDHAGFYGEDVFREVCKLNDRQYSSFSSLIRSTFDEASRHFVEGAIDLLHIDGRHFFDDVQHDFETWRTKLSNRAIVLFHDINVREREFGVFRIWNELREAYPYFEFLHGHGLGVLGMGKDLPGQIQTLLAAQASGEARTDIQRAYARLGSTVTLQFRAEQFRLTAERQALVATENIDALRQALSTSESKLRDISQVLSERNSEIVKLQRSLVEKLQQTRVERGATEDAFHQTLAERDAELIALDEMLSKRSAELNELQIALSQFATEVSQLQSTILQLHASTSWRITAPLRFMKRQLGQLRYSAVGYPLTLCWQAMRTGSREPLQALRAELIVARSGLFDREWYNKTNPDVVARGIDPVRHYIAFGAREQRDPSPSFSTTEYLRRNPDVAATGWDPLSHFILCGASDSGVTENKSGPHNPHVGSSANNLREAFIAWHGRAAINFPPIAAPEVSVIIPAHRGLSDLETCLRSLAVHRSTEPTFEVIVLDDCPDEPVLGAIPESGGLIKIANQENLGFLLTCNRGAAAARGRILCFLNSDTIVSAGWLQRLVEALDEVPRAAVAGGMLLNVDGTIQDAGWRILGDGWGRPIGRGSDPHNGSYMYRRFVDCVGGACFVVPRNVWEELDGFDPVYAPAYYEEFDFAFRAKERGLQVIYEPRSRVMHIGSASYSADRRDQLSSINHAKFCKRFADILRRHVPDTIDEFTLRQSFDDGPVLLVIDERVPRPDQHAGDVVMSKYLAMLAAAGWRVVFGPMSAQAEGPAAETLESLGVELIRCPVTIETWLTQFGKHVREVWLARPDPADKLITSLRTYTDAKITYYTHDLHHLRLQRKAEIYADPELRVEATKAKMQECEIFRRVDCVTTPSVAEAELIRLLSPATPVAVLPLYYCDAAEIHTYDAEHFAPLSDIVFVGGFPHAPNVDAAVFIAREVMPLVWRECPGARLLLIGYAPPQDVQALAGPRILVTGQVPKLESFFDTSRVFLAALRYGAGVKGKIVEAMRLGLPVVTTTVGAEGIGIESGLNAIVADDASVLARGVLELLYDAERCAALSKAGAELIRRRFSRAAARRALSEVFRTVRCGVCGSDRVIEPPVGVNFREAIVCRNCFALGRTEALARAVLVRYARDGESSLSELARLRSDLCMYEIGSVGGIVETLRGHPGYTSSEYFEGVRSGAAAPGGIRGEDAQSVTFPDESFDLVISQDVMEHVQDPSRAFAEIARVLKPGGSHIFTVPLDRSVSRSVMRPKLATGGIENISYPEYHCDPIRPEGAFVFTDFGMDHGTIQKAAGLQLLEHELPVLGSKTLRMVRVFEAVKVPADPSIQLGPIELTRAATNTRADPTISRI
jgi:GT2 family glycosyltransferase/SAM-dependent methyltransferase